jgi:hypothetical protein
MVAASLVHGHGWTGIGPTALISDSRPARARTSANGLMTTQPEPRKSPEAGTGAGRAESPAAYAELAQPLQRWLFGVLS